ncbi:hypothetical protein LTR95_001475 [Oleoguttula sp. CCFEE 5521]
MPLLGARATQTILEEKTNAPDDTSAATKYADQSEKLAFLRPGQNDASAGKTQAVQAHFVTPQDPVIELANGQRLPAVPIEEATKLNNAKDEAEGREPAAIPDPIKRQERSGFVHGVQASSTCSIEKAEASDATLSQTAPASRTNPLFPPLPMYGPPSILRSIQCRFFRATSAVLSFLFLLAIVAGAAVTSVPKIWRRIRCYAVLQNPDRLRPFHEEEKRRSKARQATKRAWVQGKKRKGICTPSGESTVDAERFEPTEGGADPLIPDLAYYARRVGLNAETFEVQTEDGFIIELYHVYDPREYTPDSQNGKRPGSFETFRKKSVGSSYAETHSSFPPAQKKYPVLMMHGLLQAAGAFCCNDDDSLAFFLAKSGYDVWLGNNRCGFKPRHTVLGYGDPRMWAWNLRQMAVMDLPALIDRVLAETGFSKLALIAHSQGTTQTFVALAKEQRPDIGNKISVFCALAPAAYSGPLIAKAYLKFMSVISHGMFRLVFGIHAFIPMMHQAHLILPGSLYSFKGYVVFSFLFLWSDARWDRGLRNRMFQFAPVHVSAESMRWWLGRECFAKHKCILATREEGKLEDKEDEEDDEIIRQFYIDREPKITARRRLQRNLTSFHCQTLTHQHHDTTRGKYAWYDDQFPPLALWVCGSDDLVDGRRLLRRFDRGREPHVRIVHKKIVEGYEHLDVIWAMDMIDKVGKEVREVMWRTASEEDRAICQVPEGCEAEIEVHPDDAPGQALQQRRSSVATALGGKMFSGGRARMASISESPAPSEGTMIDATKGQWSDDLSRDSGEFEDAEVMKGAGRQRRESDEVDREGKGFSPRRGRARTISEVKFTDLDEKGDPFG